ncbi:hypothetical protein CKAN_02101000 [Cinnamomum micranthum f. kanehirae]|uniref:Uncharacterized protein n=1 Tax=Cinnamomum micranthum f. kanehirae TaxID=337451 RepID=A0A443PM15_9MAGN|nr:hypothetical protein CKAN_02101000 [Cinnamomum micranthum f. kanehirae]
MEILRKEGGGEEGKTAGGANTSVPGWIHIGTGIKGRLVPVLNWNQKTVFPGVVPVREAGSGSGLEKMCVWEGGLGDHQHPGS